VFGALLFLSFFSGIIPAEKSGFFAVLSLLVPVIFLFNILLVLYWMFKSKKFFLLSFIFILVGLVIHPSIYMLRKGEVFDTTDSLSIISFNARDFNELKLLKKDNVDSLIVDFIEKENADIVCFQEFHHAMKRSDKLAGYRYKFIDFVYGKYNGRVIQAIYSKYPILKVEPIEFPKSSNSAIYADILIKADTLRLYNVHLQSFKIIPNVRTIKNQDSKRLFGRIKKVMNLQKQQVGIIKDHYSKSPYRTILVGDFNNTPFSNVYKTLKGDFKDSFLEQGKGFGRTYDLKGLPMRIDYIMADDSFEIIEHQNYDVKLSDHYPIKATLQIK
jgi:endonuclease/exonuclease/phosphatase family metal-dependent hydrolase